MIARDLSLLQPLIELMEKRLGLKRDLIADHVWREIFHERMTTCGISRVQDYSIYLQQSSEEWQELIEKIVTPETWFFRDRAIYDYLILLYKQRKFQTPVTILSLACSTGEEPYSVVMAFSESGINRNAYVIDAVDISKRALEKAKLGIYRKNSFRGKDLGFRNHFFTKTHSGYLINNEVKERVTFYLANLLEEPQLPFKPYFFQVIFCRNLLIYLDPAAQNRLMELIQYYLAPEGILFVGPAETQIPFLAGFAPVKFPGTYAFQTQAITESHQTQFLPISTEVRKNDIEMTFKNESTQQQAEKSKKELYQRAVNEADKGDFDAAQLVCHTYIQQFGASADVCYLLGLIDQALGREKSSEECFRKAIYLHPSHYEALICLSLICESKGDTHQAELFRKRAQKNL